jgi:ABC-2 type transport system permease protein
MKTLHKYLAFARIAARQQLSERGELYGRVAFFAVILGVFSSLWHAVGDGLLPEGASSESMVWYLAATEWILLSAPQLHTEIAEDFRRGDIAVQLPRPVSYLGAMLARGLGTLLVRAPVLGASAFLCAFAFTRTLPEPGALLLTLPFGLCASALLMACFVLLGLASFWLTDITPVYWVWQKLLFVCGGLMLPLSFYPAWFRTVASFTPFPTLLFHPSSFLLGTRHGRVLELSLELVGWALATLIVSHLSFQRAARSLQLAGG